MADIPSIIQFANIVTDIEGTGDSLDFLNARRTVVDLLPTILTQCAHTAFRRACVPAELAEEELTMAKLPMAALLAMVMATAAASRKINIFLKKNLFS